MDLTSFQYPLRVPWPFVENSTWLLPAWRSSRCSATTSVDGELLHLSIQNLDATAKLALLCEQAARVLDYRESMILVISRASSLAFSSMAFFMYSPTCMPLRFAAAVTTVCSSMVKKTFICFVVCFAAGIELVDLLFFIGTRFLLR